jgi:hypothetical protein
MKLNKKDKEIIYMIAYHVSTKEYCIGEIVNSNNYYDVTLRRGNEWVEELLERYRPKSCPNRLKCVFSFEKVETLGFYSDYLDSLDLQFYEVELLSNPCKSPMVLCGHIQKNRNSSSDLLSKLATEYWSNTLEWNFIELLCGSFRIIRRLDRPSILEKVLGMGMYEKDKATAKTLK